MLDTLLAKLILALVILAGTNLATGIWQHHEGSLSSAAKLSAYKATQAEAATKAAQAAQQAQAQADAAMRVQQQTALTNAQKALEARDATLATQAAKLTELNARLHAIPSTDKAAATWLGPLPLSIKRALNASGGVK